MLLGGETPGDSYSPTSNGNLASAENENISNNNNNMQSSGNLENNNNNLLQQQQQQPPQSTLQQISDDFNDKVSSQKDNNQNFLPENNLDLYQAPPSSQHQNQNQAALHISPRVQPYDLNIAHQQAHHHHLRSSNHMNQLYSNGRKSTSPYKNLNMINPMNSSIIYDGIVSSSSGNADMMVLKEEPENY